MQHTLFHVEKDEFKAWRKLLFDERMEVAERPKAEGNDLYKQNNFMDAINKYEEAPKVFYYGDSRDAGWRKNNKDRTQGGVSSWAWMNGWTWTGARGEFVMWASGDEKVLAPEACCVGFSTYLASDDFAALYSHKSGWNRHRGSALTVGTSSYEKWWDEAIQTMLVTVKCRRIPSWWASREKTTFLMRCPGLRCGTESTRSLEVNSTTMSTNLAQSKGRSLVLETHLESFTFMALRATKSALQLTPVVRAACRFDVKSLSMNKFGCWMAQRRIHCCTMYMVSHITDEIQRCSYDFLAHPFGNYVLQVVWKHGRRVKICSDVLSSDVILLRKDNCAHNLVDNCFFVLGRANIPELQSCGELCVPAFVSASRGGIRSKWPWRCSSSRRARCGMR